MERLPFVHASGVAIKPGCVGGGLGVVAAGPIKCGDVVEKMLLCRLLESYPGHDDEHVFVWWKGKPGTGNICWCQGSGNAVYYNTGPKTAWNTRSLKDFDNDVLALVATRDIAEGEEIIIMYSSINWRTCWDDLRAAVPPPPPPQA
ncbi:hypothetical protein M885DRAFT_430463 [Pelagophyceae sp. CCMP2097]|nr:hypothetical protein M885DRAFT_430463 [Pelagophyceae sp. CCMP2097]